MENTDSTPTAEPASDLSSVTGTAPEGISVDAVIAGALDKYDDSMEALPESSGKDNDEQSTSKEASEEDATTTDSVDDDPTDAPPQEASEEGDADQDEETTDSDTADEVEAKTKEPPIKAPKHWNASDKKMFDGIPTEGKEWLLNRYGQMTKDYQSKTQEAAQIRQQYQPMDQVLAPVRGQLQANNINESEYVGRLIEADKMLQQNPVGAIQYLAQQAGVDLDTLEAGEQQYADPQIAALQNRVELLTNHLTNQEQVQAESQTNELYSQIEGFRGRQGDDGNRLYPHFDSVRQAMGGLIQTGQAQSMEDAYNKAVRLDDGLYKETLVAERKKAKTQEDSRRKEAVQKAKKVQSSKGSRPTRGSTQSTDLDDLIGSAMGDSSFG